MPRIAYDKDGTGVYHSRISSGALTTLSGAQTNDLNSEKSLITIDRWGGNGGARVCFAFPTNRDIVGWWVHFGCETGYGNDTTPHMETSTDTTNTIDGTWTNVPGITGTPFFNAQSVVAKDNPLALPYFRTTPGPYTLPTPLNNVKFLRFWVPDTGSWGVYWMHIHLFGKPTVVADRLDLWHPTLDQPLSDFPGWFDWGDTPRLSTPAAKSFRLKNRSAGLTANSIVVAADSLSGLSPSPESQTQFRYNAGTYAATATLASLGPGATSLVFDVKLALTASAVLGLATQRYGATAGSWT
jgi:hypothetical protein